MTRLTVVAPVYNEAAILEELSRRCVAAARSVDPDAEVLLVDDGSTDGTAALADTVEATLVTLPRNQGQLRATLAGLARARGRVVVVLDGDLQDPPEQIGALVAAWETAGTDVVFATKQHRDDPAWFLVGRAVYGLLQRLPGVRAVPPGVGAYCALSADLAARTSRIGLRTANLAAVLVALGASWTTVPYDKAARYDGTSRIGALGLVDEAWASLLLTGAAPTALAWLSVALTVGCLVGIPAVVAAVAWGATLAAGYASMRVQRQLEDP